MNGLKAKEKIQDRLSFIVHDEERGISCCRSLNDKIERTCRKNLLPGSRGIVFVLPDKCQQVEYIIDRATSRVLKTGLPIEGLTRETHLLHLQDSKDKPGATSEEFPKGYEIVVFKEDDKEKFIFGRDLKHSNVFYRVLGTRNSLLKLNLEKIQLKDSYLGLNE
eukprot:GHVP01017644.1.p1 GENE.GHVP01017644.1~~GHVP01017644.1.p1  ORF type:complete len:164 (-),score=20.48 GHVP01017644.1:101-592(-)